MKFVTTVFLFRRGCQGEYLFMQARISEGAGMHRRTVSRAFQV